MSAGSIWSHKDRGTKQDGWKKKSREFEKLFSLDTQSMPVCCWHFKNTNAQILRILQKLNYTQLLNCECTSQSSCVTLMILLLRVRQASLLLRSVVAIVVAMLIAARMQEPSAWFSQPTSTSFSIPDWKAAKPGCASPHFGVSVTMADDPPEWDCRRVCGRD